MLVVIIPGELSAKDETHRKKLIESYKSRKSSFVLLTSLHYKKFKNMNLIHFRKVER